MTHDRDSQPVADALAAVRDAVDQCHAVLADTDRHRVADLLATASAASDLTATILRMVAPLADETEPGTENALERAADLAADSRGYIVTGLHLMAGAKAIADAVISLRQVTARSAQRRVVTQPAERGWWMGWAALRARAVRWWQEVWMPPDPDPRQATQYSWRSVYIRNLRYSLGLRAQVALAWLTHAAYGTGANRLAQRLSAAFTRWDICRWYSRSRPDLRRKAHLLDARSRDREECPATAARDQRRYDLLKTGHNAPFRHPHERTVLASARPALPTIKPVSTGRLRMLGIAVAVAGG
ncbi:hypothetical protein HDA40_003693 [Hamadaea flava]|uniref:Uncharacterized protein n=1 Tax=Hamadaea flava TaxID=1742688 RepID=A0ABV8LJ58_9ACTN|nr:hypothetical protein [Hamadaea flava]MCP2325186.1 hypothetical protein [Hamadaea flava]